MHFYCHNALITSGIYPTFSLDQLLEQIEKKKKKYPYPPRFFKTSMHVVSFKINLPTAYKLQLS